MSELNEYNWKLALTALFQKSIEDPDFRALCLTDPRKAISEVSDIELPAMLKPQFFEKRADLIYSFLLPPVPGAGSPSAEQVKQMIEWSTICTDFTTTLTSPA